MVGQSLPGSAPVLVVDDYDIVVEIMTSLVVRLGFEDIEFAGEGKTALSLLRQKPFGLILSDLRMKPVDGLDLLKAVRTDPSLKHIPFILTTASASTEDILAAKRSGADGYLVKPFTKHQLLRTLQNIRSRWARAGR